MKLKEGEIYHIRDLGTRSEFWMIAKIIKADNGRSDGEKLRCDAKIITFRKEISGPKSICYKDTGKDGGVIREYRPATAFEKKWFNDCIEEGIYMDKSVYDAIQYTVHDKIIARGRISKTPFLEDWVIPIAKLIPDDFKILVLNGAKRMVISFKELKRLTKYAQED